MPALIDSLKRFFLESHKVHMVLFTPQVSDGPICQTIDLSGDINSLICPERLAHETILL